MTKEDLQKILDKMPAGTKIYVRRSDNAWPAVARAFEGEDVLYLECIGEDHRNFPKDYAGAMERKL